MLTQRKQLIACVCGAYASYSPAAPDPRTRKSPSLRDPMNKAEGIANRITEERPIVSPRTFTNNGTMARPSEDWIAVLDELLGGDRAAFLKLNRLVTRFLVQLRAYDFRDEWDDLRQEVLLSVVANARAGRLRDPQAFVGYVRIITRNKFIDRLKAQLRRREKDTLPWTEEGELPTGARGDGSVEGLTSDLWAAARRLPEDQQCVLHGVYRQGKTYQQVADETGLPLGTMKRRLRDALTTLRQRFAEEFDDR